MQWVERRAPLLGAGPLAGEDAIRSVHLAQDCAPRRAFYSTHAHPGYTGEDVIRLYRDTAAKLAAELRTGRQLPRAVYVSPATDELLGFWFGLHKRDAQLNVRAVWAVLDTLDDFPGDRPGRDRRPLATLTQVLDAFPQVRRHIPGAGRSIDHQP